MNVRAPLGEQLRTEASKLPTAERKIIRKTLQDEGAASSASYRCKKSCEMSGHRGKERSGHIPKGISGTPRKPPSSKKRTLFASVFSATKL